MKLENPELTNYGCRQQFEHNSEVLRSIEKAANSVLKGDSDSCLKALSEGKRLILHRQKLVRLADRKEQGWRFVTEYEKDNLAEDSDDEKAIARARRAVNSKYPKSTNQQPQFRHQNRQDNTPQQTFQRQDSSTNRYNNQPPSRYNAPRTPQRNQQSQNTRTDFRRDRYDRECHICKRRGHLSFACPEC